MPLLRSTTPRVTLCIPPQHTLIGWFSASNNGPTWDNERAINTAKREQIKRNGEIDNGNDEESGGRTCGGDDRAASEDRSRHHCM